MAGGPRRRSARACHLQQGLQRCELVANSVHQAVEDLVGHPRRLQLGEQVIGPGPVRHDARVCAGAGVRRGGHVEVHRSRVAVASDLDRNIVAVPGGYDPATAAIGGCALSATNSNTLYGGAAMVTVWVLLFTVVAGLVMIHLLLLGLYRNRRRWLWTVTEDFIPWGDRGGRGCGWRRPGCAGQIRHGRGTVVSFGSTSRGWCILTDSSRPAVPAGSRRLLALARRTESAITAVRRCPQSAIVVPAGHHDERLIPQEPGVVGRDPGDDDCAQRGRLPGLAHVPA